jgi:hypothetical protein
MASEHEPWDKRIASHIDEIHGEIHGKVTGAGNTDRQCFFTSGLDVSVVRIKVFVLV